jgi:hypothetical protein
MDAKFVKIMFSDWESGWAVDLGGGLVWIDNIPLADGLNDGDIVQLEERKGKKYAGKVLWRKFARKSGFVYPEPHEENYRRLKAAAASRGWVIEGMFPGHAIAAHQDGDFAELAKEAGVELLELHELR